MRILSRAWQMLLKGIAEVQDAARPLAAAEMVLVRIAYAADLPTPDEVLRTLSDGGGSAVAQSSGNGGGAPASNPSYAPRYDAPRGSPRASAATAPVATSEPVAQAPVQPTRALNTFAEIIALAAEKRDIATRMALERDVRLVRCEDGRLELALEKSARPTLINDLSRKLGEWTGKRWMVVVSAEQGAAPVKEQNEQRQAEMKQGVRADPLVAAVLEKFPGAEIVSVTRPEAPELPPAPDTSETD
jgi:DNA polymerase-3 subunit gamma/tau